MKNIWLVIGAIAIIVIGGIVVWMTLGARPQPSSDSPSATPTQNDTAPATGEVAEGTAEVSIKGSAFTPQTITVKKGTTVTWTNEDSINHNVVAAKEGEGGGLPASNPLLSNGQTYSFTFDTVGTFEYKCSPHSFMTGTIEVVE